MMTTSTINTNPVRIDYSESSDTTLTQFLFVKRGTANAALLSEDQRQQNIVHDLDEAKSYLRRLRLSDLPELIIVDVPLNMDQLAFFKNWLSKSLIPSIPIIYKESCLLQSEIKQLFQSNLIDDVINDDWDKDLLQEKIRFFKSLSVQSLIGPASFKIAEKISKPIHREFIKRTMDVSLSLLMLIVLSPVLLLIAALIKLTSKGPVIYKSKRAGEGFKVFDFYKFRTMVTDADEMRELLRHENIYHTAEGGPSFFKISNDPRVTKVGQFLRKTSLDELPQLFNVLKGDMSLVGNRPLPLDEAATLTTHKWAERFMAPAGITGSWQVSKRGNAKMSAEERISLDIAYARNRSTRRDFKILLTTPMALIQKQSQ